MLSEVILDLADDVAGPGIDPVLGEALVDEMKAVLAHGLPVIGTTTPRHMGRTAYPVLVKGGILVRWSVMEPQPERTPEEEDASLERRDEEDAQRYPGHENPDETIEPDPNAP